MNTESKMRVNIVEFSPGRMNDLLYAEALVIPTNAKMVVSPQVRVEINKQDIQVFENPRDHHFFGNPEILNVISLKNSHLKMPENFRVHFHSAVNNSWEKIITNENLPEYAIIAPLTESTKHETMDTIAMIIAKHRTRSIIFPPGCRDCLSDEDINEFKRKTKKYLRLIYMCV